MIMDLSGRCFAPETEVIEFVRAWEQAADVVVARPVRLRVHRLVLAT
jgi:hypothetical protein